MRRRRKRHKFKLMRRGNRVIVRNGKYEMILPPAPGQRTSIAPIFRNEADEGTWHSILETSRETVRVKR